MSSMSKRFAGSRWTAALVLAGVLVSGFGLTAVAQSVGARWDNGLEGTWHLQVTVSDCTTGQPLRPAFPALFTLAKGGTATIITGGQPPSLFTPQLGVWRHTQGHYYTAVTDAFAFNAAGALIQKFRYARVIQLANGGDSFTDKIALQIFDAADNPIGTGCGSTVGTRFEGSGERWVGNEGR
jgi:hypothetical protein